MAELVVKSSTAADGTFSAQGATVWNAGMSPSSGQLSPTYGGTGQDFSASTGVIKVTAGTFSASSLTASDVGLGNVTNNAQTQAAIVPNTAPSSGQILAGNAGGTAYAPVSMSGDATLASTGAITVSQARGLRETTGPTTLSMGAVLDGQFLKRVGTDIVGAAASGGATWDAITAATADGSTNNGTNRIVYNTAPTADSRIAWRFTESSAATSGTSTSGVPNQVLLQLDTLASSTQSPLKVLSRASHVFSVSPTAAQILAASGSSSVPVFSFAAQTATGVYYKATNELHLVGGGGDICVIALGNTSTFTVSNSSANTFVSSPRGTISISSAGAATTAQLTSYRHDASATGNIWEALKARGTPPSPTVITTGDNLLVIRGMGYVGGTNTYQEACRITFDSTGTISDSATGIGGIMRFLTAKVGAEPTEIMRLVTGTTTGGGWLVMDEADANPGTGDLTADEDFAVYRKADKFVIAYNAAGTMNYLVFSLDGSTTTFTNSTTAP